MGFYALLFSLFEVPKINLFITAKYLSNYLCFRWGGNYPVSLNQGREQRNSKLNFWQKFSLSVASVDPVIAKTALYWCDSNLAWNACSCNISP